MWLRSAVAADEVLIAMGIPDLKFINRKISIREVALKLGLRIAENGNIHCWRPQRHQNGDRTASVGIKKATNRAKCFGCGIGPLGPVDLVMAVLELQNPGAAARWIAERFPVPELPPGKHLVEPDRPIFIYGSESEIGLLVHSGLWARLSPAARALIPVLLEFADRRDGQQGYVISISYRAIVRYSGIQSPNAIAAALRELEQIAWLVRSTGQREPGSGPVRTASTYQLTPRSDELVQLANAHFKEMRDEIAIEKALRAEARARRKKVLFTK